MRTFQTYRHPTRGSEAVKQGFSWPAFFFGGFWMIACGLWGKFGLWLLLYLAAAAAQVYAETLSSDALYQVAQLALLAGHFALWLIPAFRGNAWRSAKLLGRGYELTGTIPAENKHAAVAQVGKPAVA